MMIGPHGDSLVFASHTQDKVERGGGVLRSLIYINEVLISDSLTRPAISFDIPVIPRGARMDLPTVLHMEIIPSDNTLVILFGPGYIKQIYSLDTQQLLSTTIIKKREPMIPRL